MKLLLLVVIAMMPAAVFASISVTVNGFHYVLDETSRTGRITYYSVQDNAGDVIIPETVNHDGVQYTITTIGQQAFKNTAVTSVVVPTSISSIGFSAFSDCGSLRSITILGKDITIDGNLFSGSNNIESVTLNCSTIGASSFYNRSKLKSVILGNGVKEIGSGAFRSCSNLSTVTLPDGLTTIGGRAFDGCKLTELTIPQSVTSIGDYAFQGNLLQHVVIPNGVETIGFNAFAMKTLKTIVIGVGVKQIGSQGTTIPKTIWLPNTPPQGSESFPSFVHYVANDQYKFNRYYSGGNYSGGNPYKGAIVYPLLSSMFEYEGIIYAPTSTTVNGTCEAIDCIYDPQRSHVDFGPTFTYNRRNMTVKAIQPYACYQNTYLRSMTFGGDIPAIGDCAFSGCTGLSVMTIPATMSEVGFGVFKDCSSLTEVTLSDGKSLLTLGGHVLKNCPLDSVYIGRNITYDPIDPINTNMATSPFYENATLRSVTITDEETEILDNEFYSCTNLQNVRIGNNVTTFGKWAFSRCFKLNYLEFGANVKHIGEEAFSDCSQVTTILSHAAVPPVCDNQALADINAFTCRLLVPAGSTTAYSQAPQWESFLPEENVTGLKTMNVNFAFSIEATAGQCCLSPVAGNTRNDCLVEVVDVAGRTQAKTNWPAGLPRLSLPVAARSGAILIVKIQDVKDGRQLLKCIQLK